MATRPNIVFITSHDTGRHFGGYGVEGVRTPHIDRLASEGFLFENVFCTSPVCSPSRGAMMTGLYPQRNGLMGLVHPPANWSLHPDVRHLSHRLRDLGYRTALFFHQHEVMPDEVGERLAFDDYLVPQETEATPEAVAAAFGEYARAHDGSRPFYAQIGFGITHTPWDVQDTPPDRQHGVSVPPHLVDNEAARDHLAPLQGAVHRLDTAVGMVLDGLAASGHADHTIVVFTVDHGLELPRAKWHLYDPGLEVAFIVRCPGLDTDGGQRCPQLLSNVDVTPTLLELIGAPVPEGLDGRSFAEVFRRPQAAPGREAVFAEFVAGGQYPEARCIRTARHKFIRLFSDFREWTLPIDMARPVRAVFPKDPPRDRACCPVTQLFDLEQDPVEFVNLCGRAEHAAVEAEMNDRLWRWLEQVDDPILQRPTPTRTFLASESAYHGWKQDQAAG